VTPQTRYARTADGVHIAYQVHGDGPIDLLMALGWTANLEALWEEPSMARFLNRLASSSRLILFDKRGVGLSDRVPESQLPSLETRMDDLRAVMDAADSERGVVFGISEGSPMAMLFAATYTDRTRGLLLFGTVADYDTSSRAAENEAIELDRIERLWGRGSTRGSLCGSGRPRASRTTNGWSPGSPRTRGGPRARMRQSRWNA
jgi:pimeloyl-ACP methyl ester carboxylesterase